MVEISLLITPLQKLNFKSCGFKNRDEVLPIVDYFMICSGVILWAGATDLHRGLIGGVREVGIGNRATKVALWFQVGKTEPGCCSSFLLRKMFPDMFTEKSIDTGARKTLRPVFSLEQIKLLFVRGDPTFPALLTRPDDNSKR